MRIGYVMQEGGPDIREKPLRGPANHVWNVVRELRSLGHQVRLLACYDKVIWKADNLEDFERVTDLELDRGPRRRIESVVRGVQSRFHLPYLNFYDSLRFSHACQRELAECELIYERMGWMAYGGGLAANRMKIPLVLEANNGDFITELKMLGVLPRGLQLRLSVRLMHGAVGRATHVVATGEGHRRRFIDQWKVRPEKVSVVENGTELVGLLRREQLRAFGAPPGTKDAARLVFAGSFEPWQGVLILLRAVSQVLSRGCRVHLTLIGTGSQLPEVTRLVRELSLEPHVTLTGPVGVDGLALRLAESEVGVAPYCGWMEFSGLKLFDYKAAGLAIIASGRDGQPRTLKHGRTAWIVPPCDEQALSDAIVMLASDAGRRRSMGQEARLEAENAHTWRHTAERLQQVFESVLARPRLGSSAPITL
jgi:glycosyltransferase involved in cell wall biosynthesis